MKLKVGSGEDLELGDFSRYRLSLLPSSNGNGNGRKKKKSGPNLYKRQMSRIRRLIT